MPNPQYGFRSAFLPVLPQLAFVVLPTLGHRPFTGMARGRLTPSDAGAPAERYIVVEDVVAGIKGIRRMGRWVVTIVTIFLR